MSRKDGDLWHSLLRKLRESGVSESPDELSRVLRSLIQCSLDLENRRALTRDDVIGLVKLLSDWTDSYSQSETTPTSCFLELIKLLRNCCAGIPNNQSYLLSTDLVKVTAKTLTTLSHSNTCSTPYPPSKLVVTTILQLLGNLCVGYPRGQDVVWETYFPLNLKIACDSFKQVEMVSMVIHNCTCTPEGTLRRKDLVSTKGGRELLKHILQGDQSEWRSIFLRTFLEKMSLSEIYWILVPEQDVPDPDRYGMWTGLVELVHDIMTNEESKSDEKGVWSEWFVEREAAGLSKVLKREVHRLIADNGDVLLPGNRGDTTDQSGSSTAILNVRAVGMCIRILGNLVLNEDWKLEFQRNEQFLDTSLDLLRELSIRDGSINSTQHISKAKTVAAQVRRRREAEEEKEKKKKKKKEEAEEGEEEEEEKGVLFGLKKDILQFLSSLLHRCQSLQDRLRHLEAIPLILNQCHIDHNNPYIMQWAVLTIRNLCEDNPANQQLIAELETLGVADATAQELQLGGAVEVSQTGKLRIKRK